MRRPLSFRRSSYPPRWLQLAVFFPALTLLALTLYHLNG